MTQEQSSYAKLFDFPDPVLQPEKVLWLHVIAQALIDASSRDRDIKQDVIDWYKSDDFEVVCGMGGISYLYVSHALDAILRDKNPKRAFKKAMSFRFLIRTYIDSHRGSADKDKGLEG